MSLYRQFTTQEEIDAEYNVEAIHPDFGAVVARLEQLSAAAAGHPDSELGVAFGPTRDEYLDVYRAAQSGPRPVLVFIHGGYWRLLSARDWACVAPGPLAHGIDVVVTNYSLAPKVSIAEITRQSRAAVAWVRRHAADWGGDPDRIVVAGHSAGGQQTAMVLATDWEGEYGLPGDVVSAGLALSGLYDLRPFPYSFVGPKLALDQRTIETQSPLFEPVPTGPPRIVAWGGGETSEFVRQSQAYLARCEDAGLHARGLSLSDDDHFEAVFELNDPGSQLTGAVVSLLG